MNQISTITVENDATDLVLALDNVVKNLPKELRIVSWKVANKTKALIAKSVTRELAVAQKVVRSQMAQVRKEPTGAMVTLKKTRRIPLKKFGARQTKKGVSYRISKTEGRKKIASAFIVTKLGGHVFKRVGKQRLPIQKLFGPSPWGVFAINERQRHVTPQVEAEMRKQLTERLRFKTLKKNGVI